MYNDVPLPRYADSRVVIDKKGLPFNKLTGYKLPLIVGVLAGLRGGRT